MNREERLDSLQEGLRLAQEGAQARMWTALPGIIVSADLGAQTCSVQPAIQGCITSKDGSEQNVNLPMLVDVPLVFPRGGGYALTFPVRAGDECLVVFASRCIDAWWQSGGVQKAAERRMHDLSDGFAILAPTSQQRKLAGVSTSAVQLRDEGGATFVSIEGGTIILNGNVEVKGNITCNGTNIGNTHTHGGSPPPS